jgi:hypothetical protein
MIVHLQNALVPVPRAVQIVRYTAHLGKACAFQKTP